MIQLKISAFRNRIEFPTEPPGGLPISTTIMKSYSWTILFATHVPGTEKQPYNDPEHNFRHEFQSRIFVRLYILEVFCMFNCKFVQKTYPWVCFISWVCLTTVSSNLEYAWLLYRRISEYAWLLCCHILSMLHYSVVISWVGFITVSSYLEYAWLLCRRISEYVWLQCRHIYEYASLQCRHILSMLD